MASFATKATVVTINRQSSDASATVSLKSPRTARFAEATSIVSPIEPSSRNPFKDPPTNHYMPQPQPADVGFGYVNQTTVEIEETDRNYLPPPTPMSPMKSPLKSAMKSPGAAPRDFGNLTALKSPTFNESTIKSPTFREEQVLEKQEQMTEKEQEKDMRVKTRIRLAKMVLRGVNFGCSLIVMAMLATVFSIFNATRALAPRNGLPPWSKSTPTWPQITLLVIAVVSLVMATVILAAYFRGGHRRAEKVAVYYTTFAVAFFIFSIIMWGVGAGILNQSKANGNGQDLWGWSCKDNKRRQLFEDDVAYGLACRLQDWALVCCIIEIVVELFCIVIYGIVFYRFWSKRKLRKSMALRDRARSDLYLAQLRSQSAPNTPGLNGPLSPRSGGWRPPPGHEYYSGDINTAEKGGESTDTIQYPRGFAQPQPFTLQAPPIKIQNATPKLSQDGFARPSTAATSTPPMPQSPTFEAVHTHVAAAKGETQYAAVSIPGAYEAPSSPMYPPPAQQQQQYGGFDFGDATRR